MARDEFYDAPGVCPITGEPLYISELTSAESGIAIRGKFRLPRYAQLDKDQARLLEVFIRSRGVISTMEKELNLSYPTVRARIDGLLQALSYEPLKAPANPSPQPDTSADDKRRVLGMLEEGTISAAEAKARIKEFATK